MITSRRGFIGGLAALVVTPAVVKFEAIMPVRTIVTVPPTSNTILTINMITREAIRLFKEANCFLEDIDREYDELYRTGERREGRIVIRRSALLPINPADNRRQVA